MYNLSFNEALDQVFKGQMVQGEHFRSEAYMQLYTSTHPLHVDRVALYTVGTSFPAELLLTPGMYSQKYRVFTDEDWFAERRRQRAQQAL
jgi:hypothetical protein